MTLFNDRIFFTPGDIVNIDKCEGVHDGDALYLVPLTFPHSALFRPLKLLFHQAVEGPLRVSFPHWILDKNWWCSKHQVTEEALQMLGGVSVIH